MVGDDLYADVAAPQRLGLADVWVDAWELDSLRKPIKPDRIIRSIREFDGA